MLTSVAHLGGFSFLWVGVGIKLAADISIQFETQESLSRLALKTF